MSRKLFSTAADSRGAALLIVLIMVVILGLGAGIAGTSWQTITQRAREQELLYRGEEYRQAIKDYFDGNDVGQKGSHPAKLEDLLKDPRVLHTVRHLRKLYPDPMTGEDWFIIRNKKKKIIGVRSTSTKEPFKKDGFETQQKDFDKAKTYQDWLFVYDPKGESEAKKEQDSTSPFSSSPFTESPLSSD